MLHSALCSGSSIVCEDPVSEKMLYGIRHLYMPTLDFIFPEYHAVSIEAETVNDPYPSRNAVGAAMSFGCDSLYTLAMNGKESEYPITHLCIFNNGVYGGEVAVSFRNHERVLRAFSERFGY